MFDLLEYGDNYSMTSGSLWNYYRDEVDDDTNEINADNYKIDNSKTVTSEFFGHKKKMIGSTPADDNTLDTDVVVPLKYLSNFWKSLDLSSINCEIELDLFWSKDYIISEISSTAAVAVNPLNPARRVTETTIAIALNFMSL